MPAWRRIAATGAPVRGAAREDTQQGHVLAHRHRDARADPHQRADARDQAGADQGADEAPAGLAEDVPPRDHGDLDLSREFGQRRRVEEHRVQRDVEPDHQAGPDEQRPGQAVGRIGQIADDVGRRVPARIGVHHEYEAHGEAGAEDLRRVEGARREADRLVAAGGEARDDERHDQRELQQREANLDPPSPRRPPRSRTAVTAHRTARPRGSGGTPGRIASAYCPNAIAASAAGALNPTVAESQPAMNPIAGP